MIEGEGKKAMMEAFRLTTQGRQDRAFPSVMVLAGNGTKEDPDLVQVVHGITKRELFAAMAMQGMLSRQAGANDQLADEIAGSPGKAACWTVEYADALLAELARTESKPGAAAPGACL